MYVTPQEVQESYHKDLYQFLLKVHPDQVEKKGNSLRLKSNHSISVKEGYFGFHDFATDQNGTGITLLVRYLNYSFPQAVKALNDQATAATEIQTHVKKFDIPSQTNNDPTRVFNYLTAVRGLDKTLIKWLMQKGIIYQDIFSNAVFINVKRDYFEVKGIYDTPFKQNYDRSQDNTNFWYFRPKGKTKPKKIYICESAIDAISLFLLLRERAFYASIGGVSNQQRIDRIKSLGLQTFTAFDDDEAGNQARERNNDVYAIVPQGGKDWNECLTKGVKDYVKKI